jgi:hypothetical protein
MQMGSNNKFSGKMSTKDLVTRSKSDNTSASQAMFESRMSLAVRLWRAGIRADFMYDDGSEEKTLEDHLENCLREGIL